jgi:hypothetical protein
MIGTTQEEDWLPPGECKRSQDCEHKAQVCAPESRNNKAGDELKKYKPMQAPKINAL